MKCTSTLPFQLFPNTMFSSKLYIYISVNDVQLENAHVPIFVTLFGISMLVKPAQPANAYFPMLVTLSGISILVKPVHPLNA